MDLTALCTFRDRFLNGIAKRSSLFETILHNKTPVLSKKQVLCQRFFTSRCFHDLGLKKANRLQTSKDIRLSYGNCVKQRTRVYWTIFFYAQTVCHNKMAVKLI